MPSTCTSPKNALNLHSRAQLSTIICFEPSCQACARVLFSRQIEPESLNNFAAQSNEGAGAARLKRPQLLDAPSHFSVVVPSSIFLFCTNAHTFPQQISHTPLANFSE